MCRWGMYFSQQVYNNVKHKNLHPHTHIWQKLEAHTYCFSHTQSYKKGSLFLPQKVIIPEGWSGSRCLFFCLVYGNKLAHLSYKYSAVKPAMRDHIFAMKRGSWKRGGPWPDYETMMHTKCNTWEKLKNGYGLLENGFKLFQMEASNI